MNNDVWMTYKWCTKDVFNVWLWCVMMYNGIMMYNDLSLCIWYIYDVHWTFVRSFWMLPEIVLAAHLLSVCVQPPAILPNKIQYVWSKERYQFDMHWILERCPARYGTSKGLIFWSRRQEAAASVKQQKVDAYESGSTRFHEERWCDNATWPGWISLRMALKIRYPMVPIGESSSLQNLPIFGAPFSHTGISQSLKCQGLWPCDVQGVLSPNKTGRKKPDWRQEVLQRGVQSPLKTSGRMPFLFWHLRNALG